MSRLTRRLLLGASALPLLAHAVPGLAQAFLASGSGTSGGGGGGTFTLSSITVTEQTGNAQTNLPVVLGMPILGGNLPTGNIVQVYDSDGVTPIATQTDLVCSDRTNKRWCRVTAILPSLSASSSKTLTCKSISGNAATGTAIAASDITGLCAGSFEPAQVTVVIAGTTYTASCATALAAGATWSLTGAVNHGNFVSGPYSTGILCSAPLKTGGGTAHDYLRAFFHVYAFKAGSGAVTAQGGANPITALYCDVMMENGYAQQNTSTGKDIFYSCQMQVSTSLTVATLVTSGTNWTNDTSGPGTLTIGSGASVWPPTSLTRSVGSWSVNDNGRVLTDGSTGIGVVSFVSGSGASASLVVKAAFGSTTLTSGNYTLSGIGHPWGSRWCQRTSINNFASPDGTGGCVAIHGTAAIGSTCNPAATFIAAKLMPNYRNGSTPAAISNTPYTTYNSAIQGTRPFRCGDGTNRFFYQWGEMRDYWPTSGDPPQDQIAAIQISDVEGMIRFDANGQGRIFGNGEAKQWIPIHFRDKNTGLTPTLTQGTQWAIFAGGTPFYNFSIGGTNNTVSSTSNPHGSLDSAHQCAGPYGAALLSGDFKWLEEMSMWGLAFGWASTDPGTSGSGLSRNPWLNSGDQQRAAAWSFRSATLFALMTPDSCAQLGPQKSDLKTWIANIHSGIQTPFVANANYQTPGPRFMIIQGNDTAFGGNTSWAMYMMSFTTHVVNLAGELGLLDANGAAFQTWLAELPIGIYTDNNANIPSDYMISLQWGQAMLSGVDSIAYSWLSWASKTRQDPTESAFIPWIAGVSATVTGSGASTVITFVGGNPFANGGSNYVGGWIGDTRGGWGKITSVSGTTVNVDCTASLVGGFTGSNFGFSTIPNANLELPLPWPSDAPSRGTVNTSSAFFKIFGFSWDEGFSLFWAGAIYPLVDIGIANAQLAGDYAYAITGSVNHGYTNWDIVPR